MDHRYNYFHQNPNVLGNGQPTYNRSSADGTQPTNNYSGSISSTSSRDQSPFNERRHINPNAVPLSNNHLYQMDSYNQPPRSSGPPRTNAKGIYDTSQSSVPNVISLAQSSAENYPINPDFQLQPHLTGLLPQQSKTVPERYPDINFKANRGSIAANMNTNYFSSHKSYPEPKIIEYDMEETSTDSSPQHTSSLYSESTDQDSESTHPSNKFSSHTLIKNTEFHVNDVTKESKSITSQNQDIPVPSQFADLNLSGNDVNDQQHSILHNAYQNDMSEDIPLSENISQNESDPILENQENLDTQFNEHRFNMPKTQTYNYFSDNKDLGLTKLSYGNKQKLSSDSNSITNYSLNSVTNSSNIPPSKPLFPYSNTEQFKKPETPNIQNNIEFENCNQQDKHIHPVFQESITPQIDSIRQSNVNRSTQKHIILNQSQPLNTQSSDQIVHSKAADHLYYQQNDHNIESVNHQSMYGFVKPAALELNNYQSITNQHFTAYNTSASTQAVDPITSAASTDPISRSSSTISEAIFQENQSLPYHTSNDQTRHSRNLSSSAKNSPVDLNNQDSTNLVKSDFDNKISQSPSNSIIENQQETSIIDQSKPVDKESNDSNDQHHSMKSQPSPPFTNFTHPNSFNFQSDSNYQQSATDQLTFQQSTADGFKTSTVDQLSNNAPNMITQSTENKNLIIQPSTTTTNHSVSKYFDSMNASNQSVLNQQSPNLQPHAQPQNVHSQDLNPTTSSFPPLNNFIASSNVQNTANVIYSSQQSPSTKMKSEATESLTSSKEIVSSESLYSGASNNSRNELFQNSSSKTLHSQIPDNVSLNNQFSNLAINNKQNNIPVGVKQNQDQTTSVPQISKEIPFDKEENMFAFHNSSSRAYGLKSSSSEFSKNVSSLPPDLNQPIANQFPPQQFDNKVTSSNIQPISSATYQAPSKIMNSDHPISGAMSPTAIQHSIQFSNQSTVNAVSLPSQIPGNQPKLVTLPAQQSTSSMNVIPTSTVVVSSNMNQYQPQIFNNHPKSNAESSLQQTSNFNLTQQINTPISVTPVPLEFNQVPQQTLYNQPKSGTTQPLQQMPNLYTAQPFNNQQTPAMVTRVSSAFDQLPPSTLSNQPTLDSIPTAQVQNLFKKNDDQSIMNTVPSVPSNIKQFPPQMLNGPAKSEVMPPLQPATSSYPSNSFNNQYIQNSGLSKTNQLPSSVLSNPPKSNNFQSASSQHTPQTLSDQSKMNIVSPVPYEASQLSPQMLSNQFKADAPLVQTTSSWYSSQSYNNQQTSNVVNPVLSVANQVPSQMYSSQSKSDIVPPLQPNLNQYPSQLQNNQLKSRTIKYKLGPDEYLSQQSNNQSTPNIPFLQQVTNQYPSQSFNSQSKINTFLPPQSVPNKYPPQPISHQQGISNQNQPPLNNQLYNQTNAVQPNQYAPQPSTNKPIQLSTTPQFSNQINPMLSQQKSMNLSSNLPAMPPYANLPTETSGSQNMLSPNALSSNNHFNQVQGIGKIQQSQPPVMLPSQKIQYPPQNNLGTLNQINYQQPSVNYGQGLQYQPQAPYMSEQNASVVQQGFAKTWGHDALDLLKCRDVLPSDGVQPPEIKLPQGYSNCDNCSPEIFRCTLNKFPSSKSLLDKSRLPLGILIHPYKDLSRLTVIQCETITRCRNCRSYINPFVQFIDNAHWKCNLCYRVNELPGEFQIDPYTKRLGDPSRRPEILNSTIEYIASQDYMVRPPQPALYLFLLDVSRTATLTGYLEIVCDRILNKIMGSEIPGDSRTNIGFITYDSSVHFYQIANNDGGQPKQLIVSDISDIFLPLPGGLMVNLEENKSAIKDLLTSLPNLYRESYNTGCALGAALQAAFKMLKPRGGRVSVFQACLPNIGPGSLQPRDDGTPHVGDSVQHMAPSTDFYKKLALECSAEQIAVDLFFVSSQYVDIATISGISKYSAGCIHYFPQFDVKSPTIVTRLVNCFDRYLSRKIGFEALLRLRCTRGVAVHSFHGNFFVRSSDLLMLPNVNPDNAYGMQLSIEDSLDGVSVVCFQAALLYTSSNAERRIRVHTLCIPVTDNLNDVFHNADQQAITCLIAKMAVDRSTEKSLSDAREAFFNAISDSLSAFKLGCSSYNGPGTMLSPLSLKVFPLYILATLKHAAFRTNQPTRLDERMFSMCQMKSLPLHNLVQFIYPDLYPLHNLEEQPKMDYEKLTEIPLPPVIQLSAERVESNGIYLMDDSETLTVVVGHRCSDHLIQQLFGYVNVNSMPELTTSLAEVDSKLSYLLRSFISYLQHFKSYPLPIEIIKDNGPHKLRFYSRLTEDKFESSLSYYEFLQRLSQQVR